MNIWPSSHNSIDQYICTLKFIEPTITLFTCNLRNFFYCKKNRSPPTTFKPRQEDNILKYSEKSENIKSLMF